IALLLISASLTTASILLRRLPAIFFALSMLTLFILGIGRMEAILNPFLPENHITKIISDGPLSLAGSISEPPERLLDKTRLYINLSALYIGDVSYPVTGRLLLTVGNTTLAGDPIPTPTLPLKGREFSDENRLKYGDKIRFLAKIKKPRNFHNPGGFDYERYLALKGIFATAYLRDAEGIVKTDEENPSYTGWIEGMRDSIRENVFKNAGDTAPVLLSLITGEQGEIPKETREAFSRAGTAHILAISGEHIGLITLASYALFIWLLKRSERVMLTINIYKAAAIITIPGIVLYSMVAGSGFSIVRAVIMGGVILMAVFLDRRRDIASLVAFAASLILTFEPQALFDISFQLSFASVISLALIVPHLNRYYDSLQVFRHPQVMNISPIPPPPIPGGKGETFTVKTIYANIEETNRTATRRILSWFAMLSFVSIAAAIGTSPLVAYYFNRVSIISPVANLVTVPIIGFIIVPIGLLSSILIPVSQTFSGWLISVNSHLLSLIIKLTALIASVPMASIRVVTPDILEVSLFYLLIASFIYRKESHLARRLLIAALALMVAVGFFHVLKPGFQKDLKVTFLDVGQGESTLIEFPGGKRMLIDGGGFPDSDIDVGEMIIAPFLWHERIREIDYLVLSHPNSDHYGGLPFILRNFNVGEVWESGVEEGSDGYAEFKRAVREGALRYKAVGDGEDISVNGVIINVLNPPRGYMPKGDRAANNGSLVLKVSYGDTSFLFTGDIEKEAEYALLSKGDELKSTILKVPHHGSLTSSTVEFLNKVRPGKAVFSVGYNNRFGFPKEAVLKRYEYLGTDIYRTDRDGAITASTDGANTRFFKSTSHQALSR
ncbi:MAG TPA: DNA internalization-related competence protein ComEC/Rec2, partial [Thermodesulfobacteriota bacterium]|nr:DNA internalization-related competence protein ComEC/Rec2 [Thermodesulfobacteriota bacterium]